MRNNLENKLMLIAILAVFVMRGVVIEFIERIPTPSDNWLINQNSQPAPIEIDSIVWNAEKKQITVYKDETTPLFVINMKSNYLYKIEHPSAFTYGISDPPPKVGVSYLKHPNNDLPRLYLDTETGTVSLSKFLTD